MLSVSDLGEALRVGHRSGGTRWVLVQKGGLARGYCCRAVGEAGAAGSLTHWGDHVDLLPCPQAAGTFSSSGNSGLGRPAAPGRAEDAGVQRPWSPAS